MSLQTFILRVYPAAFWLGLLSLTGCERTDLELSTTSDVNMTTYFLEDPGRFSEWSSILEKTGYAGFLEAYGEYTCFAPTNEGVQAYLQQQGIASVDAMDTEALRELVAFHVTRDTLNTVDFTDGKLKTPTMQGQYLTTRAVFSEGVTRVRVNRQADIIESNVSVGNGVVHVIDHMLEPARQTLAELIENTPGYGIFTEALKETGFYDLLNERPDDDEEGRIWFTLLAQPDEVYEDLDIHSYADLKARYSQTGDPSSPDDSLYMYMAYHCLDGLKFLADIVTSTSHETLAPQEVVTVKLSEDTILLNEQVFNDVLEKGVPMDREASDYPAFNGVLHGLAGNVEIKVRVPFPVYWDVADQPEIRAITDVFRKPGQSADFTIGQLQDITWENPWGGDVTYFVEGPTSSNRFVYDDFLRIYLRTAVVRWVEFKTPLLVKGRYKIWVCTRRLNSGAYQAFFDGAPLPRLGDGNSYYPTELSDRAAEAQGFKYYTAEVPTSTQYGRLLGTVEVETTGRHTLRLVAVDNTKGHLGLDMIHFIPADQEQLWPRFQRDGTPVYE